MNAIRLASVSSAVLVGALLLVTSASGKPPAPPMNVACSQQALVDAINAANSAGGGTLNLAPGCHYLLTSSPDDSQNGLPAITTSITINGNQATIDGTNSFRDFEVDGPGGSLSVRDLTITGGSAQDFGGGIVNFDGSVTLDHSQVTNNSAGVGGGGIASATFDPSSPATLTVRHSVVSGNQQLAGPNDNGLGGGGILNVDGTATVDHSQVNGNTAQGFVGGGIANEDFFSIPGATVLSVDHSQVNGNTAPNAGGGGIQNLLGSATIDHSQVDGNTALNGGGIASGNQGGPATADLTVKHSEVNGNTATAGPGEEGPPLAAGGIANGSVAVIDHSQVDGNSSPNGAGAGILNHATMTISHSEVDGNSAAASGGPGSGGGILNLHGRPGTTPTGVLNIDHSQIDSNSAGGWGGGIANGLPGTGPGGGGELTLTKSEVRLNTAAHGGGIFNRGGTVTLSDTHVTDNVVDNCEPTNSIAGCTN
jgi:predicted outer membrane repeat protein